MHLFGGMLSHCAVLYYGISFYGVTLRFSSLR